MKYFLKKLMGHEIFRSMGFLGYEILFEKIYKTLRPPSYILNVRSLKQQLLNLVKICYSMNPERSNF